MLVFLLIGDKSNTQFCNMALNITRNRMCWVVHFKHTDKRLILFLYWILAVAIWNLLIYTDLGHKNDNDIIQRYPNAHFRKKQIKKILIWKPFLGDNIAEQESRCLETCSKKCEITTDKTDITKVDAVNFHLSDLWDKYWSIGTRSIIQLPTYRRPDQVWIISNMEPPQHLWGDLKIFNGLFNWTQWYRSDSDIKWLYGGPYKLNRNERNHVMKAFSARNFFREKSREVAGRISNCMDSNRRYTIIQELQQYLDIEMYGLCYDNPCGITRHEQDKSCDGLIKQYKFYLAFENNDCRDYVTEKYWYSLQREQIPIVNWKLLDRSLVIPNSYINIYDFKDLKSLARHIKEVSANETLYNSYFEWKKTYANRHKCPSCHICEALHDDTRPAQVYTDLDSWIRSDICDKVGVGQSHLSLCVKKTTIWFPHQV